MSSKTEIVDLLNRAKELVDVATVIARNDDIHVEDHNLLSNLGFAVFCCEMTIGYDKTKSATTVRAVMQQMYLDLRIPQ